MNDKDLNLFFCLGMLIPLVLIGLAIRDYFNQGQYALMIVSIMFAIIILLLARWFYNNSRRKDDNGGIRIIQ